MNDPTYGEAALEALGRNVAIVFRSMVEGGMARDEALEVVKAWMIAAATNAKGDPE